MTHEQLIAQCTQWFWNTFPEERRMLYAINNNVSAGLTKQQQIIEGNKNKAKGVVAGVLDIGYILPQKLIFMDGKVGKDTFSKEQLDFIEKAEARGCICVSFSTFEEFTNFINMFQEWYMV